MTLKIHKYEGTQPREIITGMILDRTVLGRLAPLWDKGDGPFEASVFNLVGKWCVNHLRKYDAPPGKTIRSLYERWAAKKRDEDVVREVETLLSTLSEDWENASDDINPDYILDMAENCFSRVSQRKLKQNLEAALEVGDEAHADELIQNYHRPQVGTSGEVDLLQDYESLAAAFAQRLKSIVKYKGALNEFYGDDLGRDCFLAYMGPEKRGKTWILLDAAWRAMCQRKRVAFFEIGDLSKNQISRRFGVRAAGRPMRPCKISQPSSLRVIGDAPEVGRGPEEVYTDYLNLDTAWEGFQRTLKLKVKSENPYLKLVCAPAGTVSVESIREKVRNWQAVGWSPDLIVIDYADLIDPPSGADDMRDKINTVWTALRALSQQAHCLVLTATQSNRGSYSAKTMKMEHSSEDKRKMAHVTGMIGINQTSGEKGMGVIRLNWVVRREAEASQERCVYAAGCLGLADPFMISAWPVKAAEGDGEE